MTETIVPPRSGIAREHTWNAESVFESDAAWEAEFKSLADSLPELTKFRGHLGESPSVLADALQVRDGLARRLGKLYTYTILAHNVDMSNQAAAGRHGKAQGLYGQALGAAAFYEPELLAIGETQLRQWLKAEARLAQYAHYLDNLFRKQAHVRSGEVEELLGMLTEPFAGAYNTFGLLTNADFKFPPARSGAGEEIPLTQGSYNKIMHHPDREARRTGWENYHDAYLAHKNTLASNLANNLKQNVFNMRARRHKSTLAASLFDNNVPVEVFHNLLNTFKKNLPTWHRYFAIRRKALKVETLEPYDVWAPLMAEKPHVPYAQAVDWICEGLAPLGEAYVSVLRQGCLQDRWVDIYPNQGKASGAFSSGAPGTYPFILMSYEDSLSGMSTLAHELGHSLHSYLTWQNQPMVYSDYSLFVAEVASNFHQALVRARLFQTHAEANFQIGLIEEAMGNFHRYFFVMPTLARFELEAHERAERGESLTADDLINLLADLYTEGYGGAVHVDRERVGIDWATFPHMYMDYYVYQYATGISGAHALARRILSGASSAADNYLSFLKAGSSVYPLEALKIAGVDLTTAQPVEDTFAVLADMVDRLEKLVG